MHIASDARPSGPRESADDAGAHVELFSACPVSVGVPGRTYLAMARDVARWGERHGFRGALIYSDNRLVDPWLVAQSVVQATSTFAPLVAVQPAYMHPYAVANMIASFSALHGREVFVNWVAGGFKNDLVALGDDTPHDQRYDRLVEYATIVRRLTDGEPVTLTGAWYDVHGLKLRQPVETAHRPGFMLSGSSPAGRAASKALDARSVTYALPPGEVQAPPVRPGIDAGLRVGVIARLNREDAWRTAYARFPPDRKGAMVRQLARKVSDSHWHEDICRLADERAGVGTPYWTVPFESYQTMCPYLVGNHEEVTAALSSYLQQGFGTFILDEPESEADVENAKIVFERASRRVLEAA